MAAGVRKVLPSRATPARLMGLRVQDPGPGILNSWKSVPGTWQWLADPRWGFLNGHMDCVRES